MVMRHDNVAALEKLAAMRASGILSDSEFEQAKVNLLSGKGLEGSEAGEYESGSSNVNWDNEPYTEQSPNSLPSWLKVSIAMLLLSGAVGSALVASGYLSETDDLPDDPAAYSLTEQSSDNFEPPSITEGPAPLMPAQPKTYIAVFTCRYFGQNAPVSSCLYGSGGGELHGELKLNIDGSVRQYGAVEMAQMFDYKLSFDLGASFEISAQAGSDEDAILRLEVSDGENVVFEDEASSFGVVSLASWQIE